MPMLYTLYSKSNYDFLNNCLYMLLCLAIRHILLTWIICTFSLSGKFYYKEFSVSVFRLIVLYMHPKLWWMKVVIVIRGDDSSERWKQRRKQISVSKECVSSPVLQSKQNLLGSLVFEVITYSSFLCHK